LEECYVNEAIKETRRGKINKRLSKTETEIEGKFE
jgi:uncharacterized protein YqgV (UPF0045/DUF77 family)